MKILEIIGSIERRMGGPAKAVLELSQALARRGQEVSLVATDHGLENIGDEESFEAGGVRIELFKRKRPNRYFYSPSLGKALEREIRNFDVVHIHGLWTYPTLVASRLSRKYDVPYLIRPCGMLDPYCLSHHKLRKKLYYFFFEEHNLNSAQAIHFTTEEEKVRSLRAGLTSRPVVIPLGIEIGHMLRSQSRGLFREKYPYLEGQKIILFLGRINFKKGLDLLIHSMVELLKSARDIHCVIAGPDDEGYGKRLRHWIRKEGIASHVTITGFLDGEHKRELLRDSDVFCLPSHQENFGMAVVEAMASGLPVVVSDQVNLCGEVETAEAGIVTGLNTSELASALRRLLEDPGLRYRMGQNGARLVQDKYQWDKIAEELLRLYERVIEQMGN